MCLIITALSALISFILLKIKGYRFFKELFIEFSKCIVPSGLQNNKLFGFDILCAIA